MSVVMKTRCSIAMVAASLLALAAAAPARAEVVIKLGTIAPEGSIWHDVLLEIGQRWRDLSGGEVVLRVYAGGVLGGEDEMVRKMQRRGLDALAVSGSGLPLIDSTVECLNLPMLFDSYDELARVRDAIAPTIEASFERRGYKVLSWAEAGWVHFFAKSPVRRPDDLRRLRLWTSAGDPRGERTFQELGFRVVPLPATDMLTGLQTGLIEAIDVPPLFALLDRSYQAAPYMTDLPFAPLNAATVITLEAWNRIPERFREPLAEAARNAAVTLREELQRAERDAIEEMRSRGLTVVALEPAEVAEWRRIARDAYPALGCARNHPELFARVVELAGADDATGGDR